MHPYDEHDRRHMEYVADHGMYEDFPFDEVMEAFDDAYPGFMQQLKSQRGARFENERPLA